MANSKKIQGVSKCYAFKSQLQEYAQKVGIETPVYETTNEGLPHEPSFRSTVIVNEVRYDSLLGFTNRKAAEQSAAEVALVELSKFGDAAKYISQPVHEIGLCKNLLQEYAQKMNYAVPSYQCQSDISSSKEPVYSCTVEIGGIRYIGAAARTKKRAEVEVAKSALLALWSSNTETMGPVGTSELIVLPSKKRRSESEVTSNKAKRKKVPQDSVSEDVPHANEAYDGHGPATASDFINGSGDVGSVMANNENFQGVSNCYVFKCWLQEYAQKVGIETPVYETTNEGLPRKPSFRSTVIINDVRYNSLLGFTNRKAAEQSAAEVALVELSKSGDAALYISQPVHEIGLCKNLLQEYAQKMNYAVPSYQCQSDISSSKEPVYSCTVEIGGIRYIGAAARTKKRAEVEVAKSALLALCSSNTKTMGSVGTSELTVLPSKKRQSESEVTLNKAKRKKVPQGSVSEGVPHANNVYAGEGPSIASDFTNRLNGTGDVGSVLLPCKNIVTLAKELNMVSAVKPMTAEVMALDSVSEDTPHANNVNAAHGSPTAKEANMVSVVEQMIAEAMSQDSLFEHIPHANNVNPEDGLSTTSGFTNAHNESWVVVGSCENTTTSANEWNMGFADL